MLLAIDTSRQETVLALARDGGPPMEDIWDCQQNHSVELMPHLAKLLKKAGAEITDVSGVVAAQGPGGFNSLRVGVATAKGLAFALGVPAVGVSSLEAEAFRYAESGLPVCAVMGVGREEIATAVYELKGDRWVQVTAERITNAEGLAEDIETKALLCGPGLARVATEIEERLGERVITGMEAQRSRGASLIELGRRRLGGEGSDSAASLTPLYLRRPPITQRKRR